MPLVNDGVEKVQKISKLLQFSVESGRSSKQELHLNKASKEGEGQGK